MQGGKKEESPDLPDSVKQFRSLVNRFKETIHNQTERYKENDDIQNANNLNVVIHRIKQFGRFIIMILNSVEHPGTKSVNDYFARNSIDLNSLSNEEKEACKHYVQMDIFTYPFDLRPGHINSQSKVANA
jgi:uncharacterized protein YoxC